MSPMRKGDGTGLSAKGFSEVRKGDGTVLWNAIPDSAVWQIDATTLSLSDGSGVTSWDVQIAGGSITGGSPIYDADGMNGNPLVDGDSVDDYLSGDDSALPLSNNARTIIIVHRVETVQTEYLFEYGLTDTGGDRWTMQVRDDGDLRVGITGEAQRTDPVYSASTNYITSVRYAQGDSLSQSDVRIGQTDEPYTEIVGGNPVNTKSGEVDVFDSERRDAPADGGISEIIVYDTDLSDSVWTDEIDRLASKWGITV